MSYSGRSTVIFDARQIDYITYTGFILGSDLLAVLDLSWSHEEEMCHLYYKINIY